LVLGLLGWSLQPAWASTDRLLDQARDLGVAVVERSDCLGPKQLATYNMGANLLCLSPVLRRDPAQRAKVIQHELVHVIQDCLDGLETPTSLSLAEGLRSSSSLSAGQVNGFFLQHLRRQGNLQHVVAATALLPQDSKQREFEAYALQADAQMVEHLLAKTCRLPRS
jgi:hypothetical protein